MSKLLAQRVIQRQTQPRKAAYADFQERYHDHFGDFVKDCFLWKPGEAPAPYQLAIIDSVIQRRRVGARGLHGIGKTAVSAWLILAFALTRDGTADWKIPITASVWRQVAKFTLPEVHRWARRLNWDVIGRPPFRAGDELQTLGLRLSTGEAFAIVSDDPTAIEGAHAEQILYVLDEAKAIPAPTWEAVEGAFSTGDAYALAISTPGDTGGVFYDIHKRRPGYEDWFTIHVTLQEAIAAGRVSPEWAEQRRLQWGEKSPVYLNRVLGEFAESGTDVLIPLFWVELANERWLACDGVGSGGESYGVDVARFGDDQTVIGKLTGSVLEPLEYHAQLDTMQTTGKVAQHLGSDKDTPVQVDVIGIGAGVVDRLRELGYNVTGVNVGTAAKDRYGRDYSDDSGELKFTNLRSYLWWVLRERLDPNSADVLALPPDDNLTGDLTAPKWRVKSNGRIEVESKDEIRKRIGRSTDSADALALACANGLAADSTVTFGKAPQALADFFGGVG
jgi:hypothetical protein